MFTDVVKLSLSFIASYEFIIEMTELVQNQHFMFALRKLGSNRSYILLPCVQRLQFTNVPTLYRRRLALVIAFVVKLINGETSPPI